MMLIDRIDNRTIDLETAAPIFEGEPQTAAFDRGIALERAHAATGRLPSDIAAEIDGLSHAIGKISEKEYFWLGLFKAHLSPTEKCAFVGERTTRNIWSVANFSSLWFGPMMHKAAFCALMRGYGLPVPVILAQTGGSHPVAGARRLEDEQQIKAFLAQPDVYPHFGKPLVGERSLGSLGFETLSSDRREIRLLDGRLVSVTEMARAIHQNFPEGYIFQRRLEPDAAVLRLCGKRIATVRVYTILGAEGPEVFRTVWKIPAGANMADNYWRPGNLLCAIDRETGKVRRAVTGGGFELHEVQCHPDTGTPLLGHEVLQLKEIETLALDAARVFSDLRIIGWDIAATVNGPVILEGNFAPDFGLCQLAEARGVLDHQLDKALQASLDAKRKLAERVNVAVQETQMRLVGA